VTITATVVVDLTDLARWTGDDAQARRRLHRIGEVPAGADVVIRVGEFLPFYDMFAGANTRHVNITIEADDPDKARRWIGALRDLEAA
jgi:hypothetical protein